MFLSTVLVLLAALTRLSAAFFAIPFILYALIVSDTKNRLLIVTVCFVSSLWILLLARSNPDATLWGLITHHTAQWGNLAPYERVMQIVNSRIPKLLMAFPLYLLLWASILFAGVRQSKIDTKSHGLVLTTIGLFLFTIPNLLSGGFYLDYMVPLLFVSFPITAIAYTKIIAHLGQYSKAFINVVLLFTMVLGLIWGGFRYIDISGKQAPVEEVRDAATVVSENATTQDKIFVLEALWLAVEAHRQVLPNMTMAQFSFCRADTRTANQLHLVNGQIVFNYIESSIPDIIVLTDLDWNILRTTNYYEEIVHSLGKNYRLLYRQDDFGQWSDHIEIYIRHNSQPTTLLSTKVGN